MGDHAIELGNGKVLLLNEYKGIWKIIQGYQGRDGNNYFEMTFPRGKDKQPRETAIPMGVTLGDTMTAIAVLGQLLDALNGQNNPQQQAQGAAQDDIPF